MSDFIIKLVTISFSVYNVFTYCTAYRFIISCILDAEKKCTHYGTLSSFVCYLLKKDINKYTSSARGL